MRKIVNIALVLMLTGFMYGLQAKDLPLFKAGISGSYLMNMHSADFKELPPISNNLSIEDVSFSGGSSGGIAFGAFGEYPLNHDWGIRLGINYAAMDINMEETAYLTPEQSTADNVDASSLGDISTIYNLEATLSCLLIHPEIVYYTGIEGLNFSLGVNIGTFMTSDFHQFESLDNENYVYSDDSKTFDDTSAAIENISTYFAATIGAAYDIPITENISISPHISYSYNFNNIVSDVDWKVNGLYAGIALSYSIYPPPVIEKIDEKKPEPEKPIVEKPEEKLPIDEENENIIAGRSENNTPDLKNVSRIYISFYSTEDLMLATKMQGFIEGKNVKDVKIEKYFKDEDTRIPSYRIMIEYPDNISAENAERELTPIFKEFMQQFKVKETPYIQYE